jgi:dihydrofolate reductase
LRAGLVDRMSLWVFPIVLGSGKKIFDAGTVPALLRLTGSDTYPSGALHLTYEIGGVPTYGSIGE